MAHSTDPFSASIANILEFLTEEFKAGREYRSLNCYRSAISSTHLSIQSFAVGKHPFVCRLLKGTYNLSLGTRLCWMLRKCCLLSTSQMIMPHYP